MALWVVVIAMKAHDLSSIPGMHLMERHPKGSLISTSALRHLCASACAHSHEMCTHTLNIKKDSRKIKVKNVLLTIKAK